MSTPPNVCRLSQVKMCGCFVANSRMARVSGALPGKWPAPTWLRLRRPLVGKVAVEVVEVVAEEVRIGDAPAVEIGDEALGIELVEGARVLGQARHHHRRIDRLAVVAAKLHQLAVGALLCACSPSCRRRRCRRTPSRRGPCWRGRSPGSSGRSGPSSAPPRRRRARCAGRCRRATPRRHRPCAAAAACRLAVVLAAMDVRARPRRWRARRSSRRPRRRACCRRSRSAGRASSGLRPIVSERDVASLGARPERRDAHEVRVLAGPGGELVE